jgi:hypothetical protein
MPRYRTTIRSGRDAKSAFDYMANFANSAEWDPGVLSAEQVGNEPIGLGSRFALLTSFLGRKIPLAYGITAYEPNGLVELTARSAAFSSVDTVTVATVQGATEVTYEAVIRGHGALRLAEPLLAIAFAKICGRARDGLVRELNR